MSSFLYSPQPWLAEVLRDNGIHSAAILDMEGLESDNAYLDRRDRAETDYGTWLEGSYAGDMSWLYKQKDLKFRPSNVFPGTRSMLVVTLSYGQRVPKIAKEDDSGRISVYAWGRDYHKVLGQALRRAADRALRLRPEASFRELVDASPLQERFFAEEAGLGFAGRHTLLITPRHGSWVFLGCVLSTLGAGEWGSAVSDDNASNYKERCPASCKKCLDVCPTGALIASGKIDARTCISYLTIEYKGSIPLELRSAMGDWVYGCDLCQEVCPFNAAAQPGTHRDFLTLRAGRNVKLADLLGIRSHEDMTARFAGTAIMRAGWESMLRNACVAAGNSGNAALLPELRAVAAGTSAIAREHALWAIQKLTARET